MADLFMGSAKTFLSPEDYKKQKQKSQNLIDSLNPGGNAGTGGSNIGGAGAGAGNFNTGSFTNTNQSSPYLSSLSKAPATIKQSDAFGGGAISDVLTGLSENLKSDLARPEGSVGQAAREKFQMTEIEPAKERLKQEIGKAGDLGTARGNIQLGMFDTQAAREAAMQARDAEAKARTETLDTALKLGELGLGREELQTRKDITEATIAGDWDIATLKEMGETERQGLMFNFQGTQNDLDRALTREVEAGRLSSAEADRISREKMNADTINGNVKMNRENIRSTEGMANARLALDKKIQNDDKWLRQQGIDLDRAELYGYTDADGNRVRGSLELEGAALGLKGDTLDLQRMELLGVDEDGNPVLGIDGQPIKGKLELANDELLNNNTADNWTRVYEYASLLPPDQAAAFLKGTADSLGMTVPTPATAEQATQLLNAAGQDPVKAAQMGLEMNPPILFRGTDGVTSPVVGDKTMPHDGSTVTALGYDDLAYYDEALGDWVRPQTGDFVNFTRPVNAHQNLPYKSLPAGKYQILTGDMLADGILKGTINPTSLNGSTDHYMFRMPDDDPNIVPEIISNQFGATNLYVDTAGNIWQAEKQKAGIHQGGFRSSTPGFSGVGGGGGGGGSGGGVSGISDT